MCYKRSEFFRYLCSNGGLCDASKDQAISFFEKHGSPSGSFDEKTQKHIQQAVTHMRKRWSQAHRSQHRFFTRNSKWLERTVCLPSRLCRRSSGRRPLPFAQKRARAKLQSTVGLRSNSTREELVFAAASSVRMEGRRRAAKMVEAAGSPSRGPHLVQLHTSAKESAVQSYSPQEALALLIDTKLSKSSYNMLRSSAMERGCRMYPEYRQLADAKVFCTPSAEAISVGESKAQVTLQGLLDHTASRILQQQVEVVEHITRGSAQAADSSPSAPGPSPSAPGLSPSQGLL